MRALLAPLAAVSLLAAGPGLAQTDHSADHANAKPEPTREMCAAMMEAHRAGGEGHDHGKPRSGSATPGATRPHSAAEMEAMHKRCAEMMAEKKAAPTK